MILAERYEAEAAEKGPVRMCALTRERRPDRELLRFVLDPENRVVPDIHRKLPGRGIWLTATRKTVEEAARKRIFAKAFRTAVDVPPELGQLASSLLRRSALQYLSLANKAGQVVTGFVKIEKAILSGEVLGLLHACEAAVDGRRKLNAKFRAASRAAGTCENVIEVFSGEELSMALGRENVVHAAVRNSAVAEKFIAEAWRWRAFDGLEPLTQPIAASGVDTVNQDDE